MMVISSTFIFLILELVVLCEASVHTIQIKDKHFVDTVTGKPFFIKGVDYQPGGSSDVSEKQDPLSNPDACARDILLFQELGINTVRIYSINPDLNHDACMTMLAMAGIYLILDVNSPLQNQHLNRYEPWTTYNEVYLEHVFKVVEQFSHYNNTLGFFAGNEIVNDKRSAQYSPAYIKELIGTMKNYISAHSPRTIPVGYSAADDLNYRVSLSEYLECKDDDKPENSVDFYGVNSYQWCGQQTMQTSGYDTLVDAYRSYSKPVFFSEFGCNKVLPRQFQEIGYLFSEEMYSVFCGGLVYEFSQEDNNYGLVEYQEDDSVQLLEDFEKLKSHYQNIEFPSMKTLKETVQMEETPSCAEDYENLKIESKIAKNLGSSLIKKGVKVEKGKYIDIHENQLSTNVTILDKHGDRWNGPKKIEIRQSLTLSDLEGEEQEDGDEDKDELKRKHRNSASISGPLLPLGLCLLFFTFSLFF
ncbi:BAH_G0047130.mRNA.1.CDS.1 [Saccharomyces cerevisiae]|nr:SX2_G0031210.mRNA.1.CDS.1 [Saccharomyces cerevisiae]CAI4729026.1 BAH_G0047130.mRNA.1.CDS.1 [Saccharomyces cerevisiae]CAI4732746.1 BAG_1a_G0047140.mRNA.1.CDS.1 [Saccharomyces cerevisiae]CAI7300498.1 BAG_1a_G0047140.mRNA.1.CDS.1 [Saccharomyces cerevisiae]CAI7302531.1 BAH_G0047130.mRNA.1.CDS.1 [Saccharomyces cerevisiae]